MNPSLSLHWWLEKANSDSIRWTIERCDSYFDEWYIGACDEFRLRLPVLWGFSIAGSTTISGFAASVNGKWIPLDVDDGDRDRLMRLFNEARYTLVVHHDRKQPTADELFDVFLSYRQNESTIADRITTDLTANHIRVWYDRQQIPHSRTLPLETYIRHGLKRSALMLRVYNADGARLAHMNEYERWYQCELEINNFGFPYTVQVMRASMLEPDYAREIRKLIKKCVGLASRDKDCIINRCWLDQDPHRYLRAAADCDFRGLDP